jgi:uncharacterized protein YaaQ
MKLIMAIINGADEKAVTNEMMKEGYYVTKLAGTGGFLRAGTATLISAVNNERVEGALEILKRVGKGRKYDLAKVPSSSRQLAQEFFEKTEIVVGGATVFVLNIEQFFKY